MQPLKPHSIQSSTTDGHVLTTRNGRTVWRAPAVSTPPAVPDPPDGTPEGYVPVTSADGTVTWQAPPAPVATSHREVLMASGVTPPEPLASSDGYDWLYGEATS